MEKAIHVLFILNSPGGGATQGIKEFVQSVNSEEVKFFIILASSPNEEQIDWYNSYVENWETVCMDWWNKKVHLGWFYCLLVWGYSSLKSWFHLKPLFKILKLIDRWEVDIIYTGTSLNLEGALAAKLKGKPHIWHLKETFGKNGRVQFFLPDKLVMGIFLGLSDKVIVMTEYIRSFFKEKSGHPKIQVLYDGVAIEKFKSKSGAQKIRKDLGIRQETILIGMVASLSSSWKKHDIVLNVAANIKCQHDNVVFAVFGQQPKKLDNYVYDAPYRYFESLKDKWADLQLNDKFLWAGFYQNIPALMNCIDILVHPCDQEPFGRIAIEAMAAGKPVVGPNSGGIAESVVNGKTGILVESNNVNSFTKALERLILSSDLRHSMGINGREHVKANFNQENHNAVLLKMFESFRKEN